LLWNEKWFILVKAVQLVLYAMYLVSSSASVVCNVFGKQFS
jgi:hypothetical protein